LIDREVERLVKDADHKAQSILERSWAAVDETAQALVEQETLSGVALDAVLSTVKATPITFIEGELPQAREPHQGGE